MALTSLDPGPTKSWSNLPSPAILVEPGVGFCWPVLLPVSVHLEILVHFAVVAIETGGIVRHFQMAVSADGVVDQAGARHRHRTEDDDVFHLARIGGVNIAFTLARIG